MDSTPKAESTVSGDLGEGSNEVDWRRLGLVAVGCTLATVTSLVVIPGGAATSLAVFFGLSMMAYTFEAISGPLRRQAAQLRASEERNRVIVESAQDAFILMDSTGVITQWNRQAEVIFGWDRKEVIGTPLAEKIIPPRFREAHQNGLKKFLSSGVGPVLNKTIEISALRRDGREFPVELSICPIQVGQSYSFSAFLRDITARKEAEEFSRRAREETEVLLASLPALVIVVDTRGQVVRWNPAAENVFGIKSTDVIGKHFFDAPIKWKWNVIRQAVIDCFAHSHAIELGNMMFNKPNGKEGCLQLILAPSKQNDSAGLNFVLLGIDTTEHRLLEGQLRQAQKMESIGQLAAGIAHEINTPTQFIGDNLRFLKESFADLGTVLKQVEGLINDAAAREITTTDWEATRRAVDGADLGYLMEEVPKAINQSLDGTDRVAKIVRAMKEFSHPSVDERKPIDLNRAVESTLTVARNEWKYVADLELELDPALPSVPCFPGDFNQVILNLVVNAAHAIGDSPAVKSGGKGKIVVRTLRRDEQVEIQIQDTGLGIPEAIRERIFDPFFTTKEVGKGTGQGLFIAHNVVVEKHGGKIFFESTVGVGTTFKIQLPLNPKVQANLQKSAA